MPHTIPSYALYGEQDQPSWLDMVHFERITERSSLHDFDIAPHVHDGQLQLLYLTRGGGSVFIDGQHWQLRAPTLILVPARHVHGFRFTTDVDGPVVTAAQRPLESLVQVAAPPLLSRLRQPLVLHIDAPVRHVEALMPLFDAIEREWRLHAHTYAAAGTALLLALLAQVQRVADVLMGPDGSNTGARSRRAAQVERFRALVDEHFRSRWTLHRYASMMQMSAGQLSRLCREFLGMSALDVINGRVVHEAQRELVYSTLSVKQISSLLGFVDDAYFGRFFRKHVGATPTAFRSQAHSDLNRRAFRGGRLA